MTDSKHKFTELPQMQPDNMQLIISLYIKPENAAFQTAVYPKES